MRAASKELGAERRHTWKGGGGSATLRARMLATGGSKGTRGYGTSGAATYATLPGSASGSSEEAEAEEAPPPPTTSLPELLIALDPTLTPCRLKGAGKLQQALVDERKLLGGACLCLQLPSGLYRGGGGGSSSGAAASVGLSSGHGTPRGAHGEGKQPLGLCARCAPCKAHVLNLILCIPQPLRGQLPGPLPAPPSAPPGFFLPSILRLSAASSSSTLAEKGAMLSVGISSCAA
jgi:hypothetical protein